MILQPGRLWALFSQGTGISTTEHNSCASCHSCHHLVLPIRVSLIHHTMPQTIPFYPWIVYKFLWRHFPENTAWKDYHNIKLIGWLLLSFESHNNLWSREKGSVSKTLWLHRMNVSPGISARKESVTEIHASGCQTATGSCSTMDAFLLGFPLVGLYKE